MEDTLGFQSRKGCIDRVSTGIQGFDDLIQGGFPKGSFVLVTGTPGSGKSIFGMQFIMEGLEKGQRCLYISVEQKRNRIVNQALQFGWEFDGYEGQGQLKIIALKSQELYELQKINEVRKYILDNHFDRVVIDSISSFTSLPVSSSSIADSMGSGVQPSAFTEICRAHIHELIDTLQDDNVTTIGIGQRVEGRPGDTTDNVSEFRADALIVLDASSVGTNENRTLQVKKMRETKIQIFQHNFDFTEKGIIVK